MRWTYVFQLLSFHYTFSLFACSCVFTLCCQKPQQWSCGIFNGAVADVAKLLV